MPLFVHARDAHPRLVEILAAYRTDLNRVVVHCFTGTAAELEAYLAHDLYLGITGWICDERRGQHLRELVQRIPENRLMIETDAPYLLPRDLRPKPKTRRNEPCHLPHILRTVADCRGVDPETLGRVTTENARRFFAIDEPATTGTPSVPSQTGGDGFDDAGFGADGLRQRMGEDA
jgi:TatD DNase family protein